MWPSQVIPLCAGAFREVNHDFTRLIKVLAREREASASEEGLSILLLVNTGRKGGAFPIMHSQFKRAIEVAIARGNATRKLAQLHYVRATKESASYTANTNNSQHRWNRQEDLVGFRLNILTQVGPSS